jgi:hypothetical protein
MNKFKNVAIKILQNSNGPLHYKEITEKALEEGLLETEGATPEASMNAQISVEIKTEGDNSRFIRTTPGTYTLNPKFTPEEIHKEVEKDEEEEEQQEEIKIESGFVGKGGEHLVCSELLFKGYNASIMSVDVGVDIVATKDNSLYGVQVKTSNLNGYATYVFDVRKVSFQRHSFGNIFYIFVLKDSDTTNYLILPFSEMEKKVHEGAIREVGHGKRYRVNIKIRDTNVYIGTMEHQMNYYLNNWGVIK